MLLCEDYHNIGPLLLSYLQFEVLNWHFDKVPKLMSRFVQYLVSYVFRKEGPIFVLAISRYARFMQRNL